MFFDQFFEVDSFFLRNMVDCEILCFASDLRCSLTQKRLEVCLLQKQNVKDTCQTTHYTCNVLGPSPAQIALSDESSDDGRDERTDENESREERDGYPTRLITEQVRESAADDGQRTRGEDACEETREHKSLEILGSGCGEHKAGEDEASTGYRYPTPVQLTERSECQRPGRETTNVQSKPEESDGLRNTEFYCDWHDSCGVDGRAPGCDKGVESEDASTFHLSPKRP